MKYLSLFSGIGGFEIAIHSVFPNAECVGYSEISEDAIKVYSHHFPSHKNLGDVTKIDGTKLKDIDLLVGGSPCQDFSRAGKMKGLDGKNGKLIFEYLRIYDEVKPKFFILENVKLDKDTYSILKTKFGVEPYKMNSRYFVPQNRIRYIWTNIPNIQLPQNFTSQKAGELFLPSDQNDSFKFKYIDLNRDLKMTKVLKQMIAGTLKEKYFFAIIRQTDPYFKTLTTKPMCQYIYVNDLTLRHLHPIECERIQGFPDNYTNVGLPYTKRFKVMGNAVTTKVIEFFVKNINL